MCVKIIQQKQNFPFRVSYTFIEKSVIHGFKEIVTFHSYETNLKLN